MTCEADMKFSKLKYFMDYAAKTHSPGCAVNVYLGGKLVFEYASGYADIETREPYSQDKFVNIYSCSKVATVTAACQLIERGLILINDPLYDYIPEYKNMTVREADGSLREAKRPILIGDLFSMTAGFNYDMKSPSVLKAGELTDGRYDTLAVVRALANEPLSFDPGEHWQYSLCHDVLAGVIETVSGEKFRDYMRKNIFDPLDIKGVFYHPTEDILKNMVSQYNFRRTGEGDPLDIVEAQKYGIANEGKFVKVEKDNSLVPGPEYDSGGAGIITTTEEYAKFVAALAGGGKGINGERILSPKTVELMKTDRLTDTQRIDFNWESMRGFGYGLGVRTHIDKRLSGSNANLGEFGWGGAAGATVIADTEENLGVFFTQHSLNPREWWYQTRLRNVVYGCL